jgi:hypothetical protein
MDENGFRLIRDLIQKSGSSLLFYQKHRQTINILILNFTPEFKRKKKVLVGHLSQDRLKRKSELKLQT